MNNSTIKITPKNFIQTLTLIHIALVIGVLIFTTVVYNITKDWRLDFNIKADVITVLPLVLATGGIFIGAFFYKSRMKALVNKSSLKEKLMGFQTASIVKFAMLEGPILFCIVVGMLTHNLVYLLLAVMLILYFISLRPTKVKVEKDLNLKGEHKSQFNKENDVVD